MKFYHHSLCVVSLLGCLASMSGEISSQEAAPRKVDGTQGQHRNERTNAIIREAQSIFDLFEIEKVIQLEARKESQIGRIEQLIYLPLENRIVVLDYDRAKEVFVFDGMGKYLFSLGKRGAGPGEHGPPEMMAYENGRIAFYSFPPQKVQIYSISNGVLDKEYSFSTLKAPLAPFKFAMLDGEMYFYTSTTLHGSAPDGNHYRVYRLKEMSFVKGFGKNEYGVSVRLGAMTVFRGEVIYSGALDGNLYKIDKQTDREMIVHSFSDIAETNRRVLPFDRYFASHQDSWYKDISHITELWPIDGFLLVGKKHKNDLRFAVFDDGGKLIRDDLPFAAARRFIPQFWVDKIFPKEIPRRNLRVEDMKYFPYSGGIVESGFYSANEEQDNFGFANPKLVIYKQKN